MIAVRVLRDGVVVRETLLEQLPLVIGRGPGCDVILADESVSRVHARVVADASGVLSLEDAGSRNGLHVGPRGLERLEIRGRVRCRLGRVELELEPVSEGTTGEVEVGEWRRYDKRRRGLHALGYLAAAVAAWLAFEVLDPGFWSPFRQRRGLQLAGEALRSALYVGVIAFVLLVALRAVGRRVRIADALQGLARVAWLWPAAGLLGLVAYYTVSPPTHAALEGWISGAALALSVALLACVRRTGPRLRFALAWGLGAAALYAAMGLTSAAGSVAEGSPDTHYSVQAPIAGWTGPAVHADVYFGRVETALREVAAAAE